MPPEENTTPAETRKGKEATSELIKISSIILDRDYWQDPKVIGIKAKFGLVGAAAVLRIYTALSGENNGELTRNLCCAILISEGIDAQTADCILTFAIDCALLEENGSLITHHRIKEQQEKFLAARNRWRNYKKKTTKNPCRTTKKLHKKTCRVTDPDPDPDPDPKEDLKKIGEHFHGKPSRLNAWAKEPGIGYKCVQFYIGQFDSWFVNPAKVKPNPDPTKRDDVARIKGWCNRDMRERKGWWADHDPPEPPLPPPKISKPVNVADDVKHKFESEKGQNGTGKLRTGAEQTPEEIRAIIAESLDRV